MSGIASASSNFLQSYATGSNWLQESATAAASGNSDWMSPSSGVSDPVVAAANAFASAHQVSASLFSSLAVNQGISVLSAQAAQSVDFFA
jgi:hypothetical protein